eukprot:scaffold210252_cov125-Cyclotella_meneghiniana.AAC.2
MSTIIRAGRSSFSLTLRSNVMANPFSTPFNQVISWLCQQLDYKTAATVSLSLLNDEQIKDSIEHEGLLDGITPLTDGDTAKTLTSLADMTVGCLIKGGVSMANTLEGFLSRNTIYDSARASLMIVGTIASVLSIPLEENQHSDNENNINIVDRISNAVSPSETVLWPLKCLMKMAVARNCLSSVLLLLNSTIPDELRWRRPQARGFVTPLRPSLGLFLALVEIILESTGDATRALLDLFDEESGLTYWLSIEDDTRLTLCLFSIHGKHVFLLQPEVRSWVIEQLKRAIESPTYIIHDEWLCDIVSGVFCNAECEIRLGLDAARKSSTKPTPCLEVSECYREDMNALQDLLIPQEDSGGLDFDILIPSLLLLSLRGKNWREGSSIPTQILLNALCDLAGRKSSCTPRFLFDGQTVMRQCALTENIQAAAFLVSGRSGLVLECADLIIAKLGITIKDAEMALFGGTAIELKEMLACWENDEGNGTKNTPFTEWTPTPGHRHVLWLMVHHTLNVITYGDFDVPTSRGKLSPIIAGRICFRAWLCLTERGKRADATQWLEEWLRRQLDLKDGISTKRLACAALVRILLFADEECITLDLNDTDDENELILASTLGFDVKFLAELSHACVGMIQSIPPQLQSEVMSAVGNLNLDKSALFVDGNHDVISFKGLDDL